MSRSCVIRHVLDCSVDEFWKHVFMGEDFNRFFYDRLGFGYELEAWTPESGFRRAKIWPSADLPAPLRALLGDRISFVEEGTYDAEAGRYAFRAIPSAAAERIEVRGCVTVEPISEHQCERRVEIELDARVPGLGGMIERYLETSTREQYDKNAALIGEYTAAVRQ